ncbi:MAG: DUF3630 family protein [Anaerolineae bacterium]|nr:DUF3630 family protein [Anaerolineae bacterium]
MDVRYYENERSISAELFRDSDGSIFRLIADELTEVFNVQWKTKIDGFDQRYWDFEFKGTTLTLHLEHFLGISIFVEKSEVDSKSAKRVLEEIGDYFKPWHPPN